MYVVVRVRDRKRFSTPADRRVTQGVLLYLLGVTNERYVIEKVPE